MLFDMATSDGATPEATPDVADTAVEARVSVDKPRWRRVVEVAVPVVVFAVAAPFAVNGLASAVNNASSDSAPHAAPADTGTATTATAAATATTLPTETTVTIPGLPDGADQQTAEIAAQIVTGVTPTPPTAADDPSATTTTAPGTHSHGTATAEQPLTRSERKELSAQLLQARSAADRYPTVADALAGGYTMVTGYVPLIGAHYIKWSLMDGNFDVNQPEMLLYDGTDADSSIVGLSYYVFSDTEPSPFVGPNDHWHQHIGLCIKDGVVVGGESTTPEECARRGGAKAMTSNGWMVHAWVVPGWESPQGVFSPEHPGLTASLPTS